MTRVRISTQQLLILYAFCSVQQEGKRLGFLYPDLMSLVCGDTDAVSLASFSRSLRRLIEREFIYIQPKGNCSFLNPEPVPERLLCLNRNGRLFIDRYFSQ